MRVESNCMLDEFADWCFIYTLYFNHYFKSIADASVVRSLSLPFSFFFFSFCLFFLSFCLFFGKMMWTFLRTNVRLGTPLVLIMRVESNCMLDEFADWCFIYTLYFNHYFKSIADASVVRSLSLFLSLSSFFLSVSFFCLFASFLGKWCGRFCVQTYAWVRPWLVWISFDNDVEPS